MKSLSQMVQDRDGNDMAADESALNETVRGILGRRTCRDIYKQNRSAGPGRVASTGGLNASDRRPWQDRTGLSDNASQTACWIIDLEKNWPAQEFILIQRFYCTARERSPSLCDKTAFPVGQLNY